MKTDQTQQIERLKPADPSEQIERPKPADPSEQIEKAKTVVIHLIERIRRDERLRYHMGYGTESFELLTDAASSLCGEPLDRVRCYASGLPLCPTPR